MKTTLFLFALIIISACSFSAVLTVSNDPLTPAQYTDLQTAVNAASSGDSIYVSGSYNNYGGVNITKQLTLIGAGANPDKQNPLATNINQIVVNANGITIEGFTFIQSKPNIGGYSKNITISRNKFYDYAPINVGGDGWTIKNNIFLYNGQVQINNYKNCLIENNIFEAVGINPPSCIVSSNQPSVAINHNLFIGNGKNGIMAVHNTVYSAVISNNIFYDIANRVYPNPQYPSYCIFLNNISYINFATENYNSSWNTNTGSGNLINTLPMFVNAPLDSAFQYYYDYHLLTSSPGHNAATDGTDIGIYGGASPFVDLTGSTNIPQVTLMDITDPYSSVLQGDSLHIHIKARKHD